MRQYQTKIKRTILHIQNKYIISKITFYTKKNNFTTISHIEPDLGINNLSGSPSKR